MSLGSRAGLGPQEPGPLYVVGLFPAWGCHWEPWEPALLRECCTVWEVGSFHPEEYQKRCPWWELISNGGWAPFLGMTESP